jgi:hypothetical protein
MSWMTGLGQGLLGASDVFSRYIVEKEGRRRRDEDVKHRTDRDRIEDEFRKSTLELQKSESEAARKDRERSRTLAEQTAQRERLKDNLRYVPENERLWLNPEDVQKYEAADLGGFIDKQTNLPLHIANPMTGMTAPTMNVQAGASAKPLISAAERAQIEALRSTAADRERGLDLRSQQLVQQGNYQQGLLDARGTATLAQIEAARARAEAQQFANETRRAGERSRALTAAQAQARANVMARYKDNPMAMFNNPNIDAEIQAEAARLIGSDPALQNYSGALNFDRGARIPTQPGGGQPVQPGRDPAGLFR